VTVATRKGPFRRAMERLGSSKPAGWWFLHVANPIDKRLIPATNGWVSLAPGQPILVLETVGAKSGQVRRTPLQYVADGDRGVLGLRPVPGACRRAEDPARRAERRARVGG
jgi:hypothetical protein